MSEAEKPKHPPFQVHLSTMLMASLLAGSMVYAAMLYYRYLCPEAPYDSAIQPPHYIYMQRYAANETLRLALFEGSVLILFVLGCEWLIRRREARKT